MLEGGEPSSFHGKTPKTFNTCASAGLSAACAEESINVEQRAKNRFRNAATLMPRSCVGAAEVCLRKIGFCSSGGEDNPSL